MSTERKLTVGAMGGLRELKDNWSEVRDELRKSYDELDGSDLELKSGHEQETIDRIGRRLHKSPEEAMRLVQEIAQRHQKPHHHSAASTAGMHTPGIPRGHKDMPEAAERKSRRDALMDNAQSKKPLD